MSIYCNLLQSYQVCFENGFAVKDMHCGEHGPFKNCFKIKILQRIYSTFVILCCSFLGLFYYLPDVHLISFSYNSYCDCTIFRVLSPT